MTCKLLFVLPFLFPIRNVLSSPMDVLQSGVSDWLECAVDNSPSDCLESRTVRQIHELTGDFRKEVVQSMAKTRRIGKELSESANELSPAEAQEVESLEQENEEIIEKIRSKDTKAGGLLDEIGDLFTYGVVKLLGYFSPEKQADEELAEKIIQESDGRQVEG